MGGNGPTLHHYRLYENCRRKQHGRQQEGHLEDHEHIGLLPYGWASGPNEGETDENTVGRTLQSGCGQHRRR